MQPSSPLYFPQTPSTSRFPLQYKPLNSSPLVDSPGKSSPIVAAQARRKSQYKAQVPVTPLFPRSSSSSRTATQRNFSLNRSPGPNRLLGSAEANPQKALARDRLTRYLEKVGKAREKNVCGRRFLGAKMSDDDVFAMDDDEEEDDEDIMQDELFRRIMANTNRKQKHAYNISYAIEVGSSFDPDLEDVSTWERELVDAEAHATASNTAMQPEEDILTPDELDEQELQEYAEEYARLAPSIASEDVVEDYLFDWSDGEELSPLPPQGPGTQRMGDDDNMDIS
ncbi:hypothetical protein CPB84DRAFT_1750888 [Gymnopilus junonius]|uniref:Uncharacterized protein n=1 Tax=Gymnopilus junonius TaxID=109634 RepID=A0A9P5NGP4_GYMJU|nr:hypothetical protein CPB84DRAFT_1750888 [Gymnopilus junonius]